MKIVTGFSLLIGAMGVSAVLSAQAPAAGTLNEGALYSLYVKRHDATIAFAELASNRATDNEVRKAAEDLAKAHREAREKLEKGATERHLTLAPPGRDTSTVLLEQARVALEGKSGRAFDSTWVNLAHSWITTLVLDNNRSVKKQLAANLQPIAEAHTTWLFHQASDMDKLRKKLK